MCSVSRCKSERHLSVFLSFSHITHPYTHALSSFNVAVTLQATVSSTYPVSILDILVDVFGLGKRATQSKNSQDVLTAKHFY